ncbi:ABC transporter ATP-binding protein/permease [Dethiosulfovibrio sp. F2B]|uniref:ABC transporter ATP-binding protein n=1 Tax=Dethiosulfovibrio faecalis TaxID=2720018 RepID=UPI001F19C893|nr:ABC transporter ATP-binding protein [Dethiosulfovibrio faecalis]MCF4151035.1 ABC transporter ATP-binding protein/permease [Dethiosulfovibrio faecalis]
MRKKGVARLMEIAGEKRGLLVLSGVLSVVSAILALTPYLSVYKILEELMVHWGNPSNLDGQSMRFWGFTALAGVLASMVFLYAGYMASHVAAFRILYGLRVRLAEHIGKLHLGYLSRTSTGAVKKTLEQNVEKIENFVAHKIPDLVSVLATAAVMAAALFSLNPWIAGAATGAALLAFFVQSYMMIGSRGQTLIKAYYDSLERINGSAVQYVRGMPAVKIFGRTVHSFRKFYGDMMDYCRLVTDWTDSFQNGYILFKTMLTSLLAFVLPVGVLLLSRGGDRSTGLTVLFSIIMIPGLTAPLYKMMHLSATLRQITEGVNRIDDILDQPAVSEPARPALPEGHDVAFENVSFSYGSEDESTRVDALSGLSFSAREGEVTALVGPSGSGKSTAANLIPRFWDVDSGSIKIGGVDVRDMRTEDLMDRVSFVFQDTFLFFDSLYQNILVGRPDATEEEVHAAARAAQCHDFIERLPNGYDTLIGEGGVYLSGGEEQRVAVARAILKNSPILVLDEATAFADPENEHRMQMALKSLIKDKTVIVIAHRLSTIKEADHIVVLDGGTLSEEGTHRELLENRGVYERMWTAHTSAREWGMERPAKAEAI